jgi:LuxR family maltose regulon positive regulatory protein
MTELIARTKIVPPRRRADQLSRPRVVELLTHLLGHRLILIIAPAGYGKTCALIDLAAYVPMPVCWVALDALDRDPYRFYTALIASLADRFTDFGMASRAALQALAAGQSQLEQFVTTMVNELYECANDEYLLVIDDYHFASEVNEINAFWSRFVQQVDERCHVLLAGRRLTGLPDMPLLVARGYVSGIDFEDLAFTESELQDLILKNYGQSLSDAEAAELIKATEGWITGLLLSAQSRLRSLPERVRRLRAAGVDLYSYLAQQVLDQQPEVLHDFLLLTSVLEEFDAALCAEVLDPVWLPEGQSWQGLIDEVLERRLFVVAVGNEGEWVRYHHLFQEFLHKQLIKERPEDETLILQRLARLYTDRQEWEKAHHYLQRLGDLSATARLLEQAGLSLLKSGRAALLAGWLDGIPPDLLEMRPLLLSLRGDALARLGNVQLAFNSLNQAEGPLRANQDWINLAYVLVRRAVAGRLLGDYQNSLSDADQALDLLRQEAQDAPEANLVEAQALLAKGMSLYSTGQLPQSIPCLQQAMRLYQGLQDDAGLANVSMELATVYTNSGHLAEALELYQFCLDVQRQSANLSAQAIILNNLGVLHHLQGDYIEAIHCLEEAYDCARRSGYARFEAIAQVGIGDLFADLEMWQTAQKVYRQVWPGVHNLNERLLLVYLELAIAKVAGATHSWREAFEHLSRVSQLVLDRKSNYEWAAYQLAMGRYYLGQQKAMEAMAPLRDAQSRFAQGGQPIEEAIAHFLLAAATEAAGQQDQVAQHLHQGLALAFSLQSRRPLVTALRPIKAVVQAVRLEGIAHSQAKQLAGEIEAFEQQIPILSRQLRQGASPGLAAFLVETPPRLVIHALGRAEVVLDGKAITTREWQTQISRDLFFCILAHPNGLTKEEVGVLFWPDAAPSELKSRFKNSIYRLRSALHPDVILFDNEIYRFNPAFDYEYDVEQFLNKVVEGDAATNRTQQASAYKAAVATYGGLYLPDIDGEWIWVAREQLRRTFTTTVLTLAQLQFDARDYRAALQSCQRAFEDDPCLEEAHRLAMRIYAAMGNRAAVARQYELCNQALRQEIDLPPSPQTEELYALLMDV